MHNEYRHIEQLGEINHAAGRFRFGEIRRTDRVKLWRSVSLIDETIGKPSNHVVVLGMDHRESSTTACDGEDIQNLVVVEFQQVIGHEDLERLVSTLDQIRQLGCEYSRRWVG